MEDSSSPFLDAAAAAAAGAAEVDPTTATTTLSSWMVDRLLAEYTKDKGDEGYGAYSDGTDYSVLSVTVMTLGLIIFVEVVRHKIDHTAHGRPFFTAVLDTLYSELSTLGIVEFAVWIMQSYIAYDKTKKAVFADVHFGLFYTAVLNAIQTCLVAFFATRVAMYQWCRTETLELNHYVEVREEFDRIRRKLERIHNGGKKGGKEGAAGGDADADAEAVIEGDDAFDVHPTFVGIWDRIRHPYLKSKYNQLLVQVRFHELRVHFLQTYNLPLKFKVSDYLMRSQLNVLVRLVCVSVIGWLLLTGVANLLYFVMGVSAYFQEDPELVGSVMTWILVSAMAGFIIITVMLYTKMKFVFSSIMHREELWGSNGVEPGQPQSNQEQLKLFWLSDPKFVIAAIQFMQFGYAVALAVVIIFWDSIALGDVAPGWYIFMVLLAYSIFVFVAANVVPWFTLCTSLGQLVDIQRLQETAAAYRLEEAKRSEIATSENQHFMEASAMTNDANDDISAKKELSRGNSVPVLSNSSNWNVSTRTSPSRTLSIAHSMSSSVVTPQDNSERIAELVKVDTESLRATLPESEIAALKRRELMRKSWSMKKSVSDLGSMRFGSGSIRSKDDMDVSERSKTSAMDEPPGANEKLKPEDTSAEHLRERRRRRRHRMKSASDGVAFMSRLSDTNAPDFPDSVPEGVVVSFLSAEERRETDPVDCDESVGGHSDTNDIPQVEMDLLTAEARHGPTLWERLRKYYMSRKFILISNVFGTMVSFFMVGQRVEGFFFSEGIVNEYEFVRFAFPLNTTFWVQFVWLSMFLVNAALVFLSVGSIKSLETAQERKVVVAALLDVVISGTCVVVLCAAEAARCCYSGSGRFLEDYKATDERDYGNEGYGYGVEEKSIETDYGQQPAPCSCPMFGSREYGGLGTIEPYTALVALRILRHWAAKRLVVWFWPETKDDWSKQEDSINPFAVFGSSEDSHSGHSHNAGMKDEHGTVSELWQTAITKYPEIVSEYGEFSQELFRAMLGIPITGAPRFNDKPVESIEMDSIFAYPNANLVRKMRRCDRKLLPICDTWTVVDVVLTSKELVYLDATEADNELELGSKTNASKRAMFATKGGKDLPLCEVTAGRKVVGQLLLSDIASIYVERELPHKAKAGDSKGPDVSVEKTEYWRNDGHKYDDRANHWCAIKQDVVKIHTIDGFTLCLRFYSDLDDSEANQERELAENEYEGPLFKNNAFQWAQTVVRLCGPGQLKQELPHFGDDTCEELRDFLVVKNDEHPHHHRIRSSGAGLRLLSRQASNLAHSLRRERDESPRRSSSPNPRTKPGSRTASPSNDSMESNSNDVEKLKAAPKQGQSSINNNAGEHQQQHVDSGDDERTLISC